MTTYRLSWEMVDTQHLYQFMDADPLYYTNVTQTVPNSQIPDEYWHPVSNETDDPWDQARTLQQWADNNEQFVRNVRLAHLIDEPCWEPVDIR